MNLRNVLRAYSLLRQLSDDESGLLNILRALNDSDREQLVASMSDKPAKSSERTIEHCAACDYTRRAKVHKDATVSGYHEFQPSTKKSAGKGGSGKSKHASSLAEKVGGTLASIAQTVGGDQEGAQKVLNAIDDIVSDRCQFKRKDGRTCMLLPDHNIHHLATAMDHHEFVAPPATHAAGAD